MPLAQCQDPANATIGGLGAPVRRHCEPYAKHFSVGSVLSACGPASSSDGTSKIIQLCCRRGEGSRLGRRVDAGISEGKEDDHLLQSERSVGKSCQEHGCAPPAASLAWDGRPKPRKAARPRKSQWKRRPTIPTTQTGPAVAEITRQSEVRFEQILVDAKSARYR